ncbi:protein RecA [Synergistales bacterium]|nr:protein RecA [Synergistales bacterium]GHV52397.1 protein RecA [Synergistales bacterium]
MAKAKKESSTKEEVLDKAITDIKQKFGEGAIMKLGDRTNMNIEIIPTGVLPLDVALGIGGIPRGRVVELYGPEGGGKTTIALHVIAEAQKGGGVTAFIDAEHALDPGLAAAIGVDITNMYISQPDSGEQAFFIIDSLVRSGAVDLIVVDSVAALTPQAEIDGKIEDGPNKSVGLHARLMSYALRRLTSIISKSNTTIIFINQLRSVISTGYSNGPSETTTGGRALKFYSSVRIEVRRAQTLSKGDVAIGHELKIKVTKNKQAPPFRTAHTTLIYGRGVPKEMAVVDMAIDMNILKKKGSWLAYKGETLAQGKEAASEKLTQHPDLMEEIRRDVLAKVAELNGIVIQSDEAEEEDPIFSGGAMPDSAASALDEDAIELDMDAPFGEDA